LILTKHYQDYVNYSDVRDDEAIRNVSDGLDPASHLHEDAIMVDLSDSQSDNQNSDICNTSDGPEQASYHSESLDRTYHPIINGKYLYTYFTFII